MGFNFVYKIKDFGNIEDAKIDIKPLTIIAGKNSTGKTFITKSLYSILTTVNKNHFSKEADIRYLKLQKIYSNFYDTILSKRTAEVEVSFIKNFTSNLEYFEEIILQCNKETIEIQKSILDNNREHINSIKDYVINFINSRNKIKKYVNDKDLVNNFVHRFNNMISILTEYNQIVADAISEMLMYHLKQNFQTVEIDKLLKFNSKNTTLNIDTIGEIKLFPAKALHFSLSYEGITEIQKLSNVVFFDSPIYTRIRKALVKSTKRSFLSGFDKDEDSYLKGFPSYIEDLYEHLDKEYIDEPMFIDLSKRIHALIAGKLLVNNNGDILYTDINGNDVPLSLTAMGIGNIGVIDILLRNNTIKKGSFLILDEPEVHLHPEWQVELASILYEIAKRGVNIILATHSIDLLKAFQVAFNQNKQEASDIIALNRMPFDDYFYNLSIDEKINSILDDLSKPYYELYKSDLNY